MVYSATTANTSRPRYSRCKVVAVVELEPLDQSRTLATFNRPDPTRTVCSWTRRYSYAYRPLCIFTYHICISHWLFK